MIQSNIILNGFSFVQYAIPSNNQKGVEALKEYISINTSHNQNNSVGFGVKARRRLANTCSVFSEVVESVNRNCQAKKKKKELCQTFITLTYPGEQLHDDKFLRANHLRPFIQEMQRSGLINQYIWKAEVQKRDVLHFHILGDIYAPFTQVQNIWHRIIEGEGYVSSWQQKNGNKTPQSSQVKGVKDIRQAHSYLGKYMSKDDVSGTQKRALECRSWGSSDLIKEVSKPSVGRIYEGVESGVTSEAKSRLFLSAVDLYSGGYKCFDVSEFASFSTTTNHMYKILSSAGKKYACAYQDHYLNEAYKIY